MKGKLLLFCITIVCAGCMPNVPHVAADKKEAPVLLTETGKEILFPPGGKVFLAIVKGTQIQQAKIEVVAKLFSAMKEMCEWKESASYYGERVKVELQVKRDVVYVRARMDESLCPALR